MTGFGFGFKVSPNTLFKGGGWPVLSSAKTIMIGDSNTYASGTSGPLELFCGLSGGKFQYGANKGVNGNTTTQMAARFAADVVANTPYAVIIMGRVNDIGAGISIATGLANYTTMINAAKTASIRCIVFASPPYTSNPTAIVAFNEQLQTLCASLGVEFIDPWASAIRAGDGTWADASYSADGVHATPKANRIGIASVIAGIRKPNYTPLLVTSNTDAANKISNGLFTASVANVPTGWSIDAALTPTIVSAAIGNRFDLSFSALAGYKLATGPNPWSGLAAGDTVRLSGRVVTSGLEANGVSANPGQGKADVYTFIQFSGTSSLALLLHPAISADVDAVFEADLLLPSGIAGASLYIMAGPRSGTISGNYALSQFSLKKIA